MRIAQKTTAGRLSVLLLALAAPLAGCGDGESSELGVLVSAPARDP